MTDQPLLARLAKVPDLPTPPAIALQVLHSLAQRLWQAVNQLTIREGDHVGQVGVSNGAASCFPHHTTCTPSQFLAAADQAMYTAKTTGKNRVHLVSL